MEEFEYTGMWWFPQFPDHQVAGILKFHPSDGATLETIGGNFLHPIHELYPSSDNPFPGARLLPSFVPIDIICGRTDGGDEITLYKCGLWLFGSSCRAEVVFVGCHFEKEDDLVFDSMILQYSNIQEWLGVSGFSGGHKFSEESKYLESEIGYSIPGPLEFVFDNFRIAFFHNISVTQKNFANIHLEQATLVELVPDLPIHYNDYHSDLIYPLRNFLSLGTGTAVLPLGVKARKQSCVEETAVNEDTPRDIQVHYVAKGANMDEKNKSNRLDMLFRYQDIESEFQLYLHHWFTKAEKLRPVFDLYFGRFYISSMYVHLELLTLTQALESYHRRMYGGVYMLPEEYEAVRQILNQAIPSHLDDSHHNSLQSRIKYGYEFSLRKRLKLIMTEVLKPYESVVNKLIGDHNDFIEKLVNTRNYLTHYTNLSFG